MLPLRMQVPKEALPPAAEWEEGQLEGLAPAIVNEVVAAIATLQGRTSILLVEQKVDLALHMADRAYVMVSGKMAYAGDAEALRQDESLQVRLLGV